MEDKEQAETKRVGDVYRGQAWIELHGEFTATELREIADALDAKCEGLHREHQE